MIKFKYFNGVGYFRIGITEWSKFTTLKENYCASCYNEINRCGDVILIPAFAYPLGLEGAFCIKCGFEKLEEFDDNPFYRDIITRREAYYRNYFNI